jgi:hypothetical protein
MSENQRNDQAQAWALAIVLTAIFLTALFIWHPFGISSEPGGFSEPQSDADDPHSDVPANAVVYNGHRGDGYNFNGAYRNPDGSYGYRGDGYNFNGATSIELDSQGHLKSFGINC